MELTHDLAAELDYAESLSPGAAFCVALSIAAQLGMSQAEQSAFATAAMARAEALEANDDV